MEHASAKLDRLSDLPDALLLRIISLAYLGACRALVKTSLVSRRWRHLWREVPCLEIDPREFLQLEEDDAPTTRRHNKRDNLVKECDRFEKFADNFLSRHSPELPLHTLRLHVINPPHAHGRRDAGRWVSRCLERCRPVKLDISNCFGETPLADLRGLGREIDLTRLTTLCLRGVVLRSGFIGASGCPRLEHLELEDCDIRLTELLLSRTLNTLVVSYPMQGQYSCEHRSHLQGRMARPRIEAPALASLRMVVENVDVMIFDYRVPSLVEASVRLDRGYTEEELELLYNLHNATKLKLSGLPSIDLVLYVAEEEVFPKFRNLTTLLLDRCNLTGEVCTTLDFFMHTAPNLEELSVHNCRFGLPPVRGVPYEGHGDLRMFHNLRTLHLDKCDLTLRSYGEAPTLLEYFLQNAPSLERLTLQHCKLPGGMPGRSKSMKMSYHCVNLMSAEIRYVKQDGVSQMVDLLMGVSESLQRSNILVSKA